MSANKPWFNPGKWDVSRHNYAKNVTAEFDFPEKMKVIDSTIRKMDNMPGTKSGRYSVEDKVRIASLLNEIGFQEVGFNTMHFLGTPRHRDIVEGCKAIAKQDFSFKMSAIVHSYEGDAKKGIDMTIDECGIEIIYIETCSSEQFRMMYLPTWSWEKITDTLVDHIRYVKERGVEVGSNLPDCPRTDYDNLVRMANRSIEAGATSLFLSDSFGCLCPEGARYLIRRLRTDLVKDVPIIYHVHDDFGMATSQAIAAASAGAWIDGASHGIGERSFVSLEEIVVALEVLYGVSTGLRLDKLYELSKLVASVVGVPTEPHRPIIGETAFTPLFWQEYVNLSEGKPYMSSAYDPSLVGQKTKLVWWEGMLRPKTVEAKLRQMGIKYQEKDVERALDSIRRELAKVNEFPFWLTEERVEAVLKGVFGLRK